MKCGLWLSGLVLAGTAFGAVDPAQRTLVVYNENEAESKPLALYYAEKRHIPVDHVVGVHVRNVETITRQEYTDDIRAPLLKFMTDRGLIFQLKEGNRVETFDSKIDYLVLVYGIPLRVAADLNLKESPPQNVPAVANRNEASVDSELAVLPTPGLPLAAWLPNPFYNNQPLRNTSMLLVGRLDAPTPAMVRQMIDDALKVEATGLLGRCYFDARGQLDAAYAEGDRWIKNAADQFRAAGYEVVLDDQPPVFAEDFPLTDAAVYAGWYTGTVTGPFTRADFAFRPGAVAYHLHSGSAETVRSRTVYWVGPLLAKGAAVAFGNVYEPYLSLTPHLDIFFKRLLAGATYAEAGWSSQPGLSWQTTFCGDPLYRPFARPVDEQISLLELRQDPDRDWAYLRKINLLLNHGETNEAVTLCRSQSAKLKSAVLAEKLGDLLPASDRPAAYQEALDRTAGTDRYRRLAWKLAGAYETNRQTKLAVAVYEGLLAAQLVKTNATGRALQDKIDKLNATPQKQSHD